MSRYARLLLSLSLFITPSISAQQVDTAGTGAVIAQAMEHSEVMQNLQYLSDNIGPRLAGSAAMKKANDWTLEKFRGYGLTEIGRAHV